MRATKWICYAASLAEVYRGNCSDYEQEMRDCLLKISKNIRDNDWFSRYFIAQMYVDLHAQINSVYGESESIGYLRLAYDELKDNIILLSREQNSLNKEYFAPISELLQIAPKDSMEESRRQIEEANNELIRIREFSLPPVSDALIVNLDMFFAVGEKLDVSENEIRKVAADWDGVLFYNIALNNRYCGGNDSAEIDCLELSPDSVAIPVKHISDDARISVQVFKGDELVAAIDDYHLARIERRGEANGEGMSKADSFYAVYVSDSAPQFLCGDRRACVEVRSDLESDVQKVEFKLSYYQKWYQKLDLSGRFWKEIRFERF